MCDGWKLLFVDANVGTVMFNLVTSMATRTLLAFLVST
mgnify:CR=1 FL=1